MTPQDDGGFVFGHDAFSAVTDRRGNYRSFHRSALHRSPAAKSRLTNTEETLIDIEKQTGRTRWFNRASILFILSVCRF